MPKKRLTIPAILKITANINDISKLIPPLSYFDISNINRPNSMLCYLFIDYNIRLYYALYVLPDIVLYQHVILYYPCYYFPYKQ